MIKLIKHILYRILGQRAYLKAMHAGFFFLYDLGVLKNNPVFKYHYFVRHLIHEGDIVVDIGANLGYFTKIFSRSAGAAGKVIAIEPIHNFFATLKWGLRKQRNCELNNYALGLERKKIEMVLPKTKGQFRTGLPHIASDKANPEENYIFEVEMVKGSDLLKDIPKINYIKCDIEGYEAVVFPELKDILFKHKPMVQIEIWGSQNTTVFDLLTDMGYSCYGLYRNKLIKDFKDEVEQGDYLFIHGSKEASVINSLKKQNLA